MSGDFPTASDIDREALRAEFFASRCDELMAALSTVTDRAAAAEAAVQRARDAADEVMTSHPTAGAGFVVSRILAALEGTR